MSERSPSARYVWYAMFLLFAVNVFNYMDRVALAMLMPVIKADLKLSDTQLGLLIGFAFAAFYAVCGIPIARWADRGNRKNIISLCLLLWSVATGLSGAARNFWHLFVARMGVGIGEGGGLPAVNSIICDYVPPQRRAGMYAINHFGLAVGMTAGMALAGLLGGVIGWRWTFVALGLPGVVLAIVVKLTLREPERGRFDAKSEEADALSLNDTVGVLWKCRTYRLLTLFFVSHSFLVYGLTQWLPSFYARVFAMPMSTIGVYFGLAYGVGNGIGMLAGGFLADRAARRNSANPLLLSCVALALALPLVIAAILIPSAYGSILLVSLASMLWTMHHGPAVAIQYGVVLPRMRATASAITMFLTAILGLGLGPLCIGLLSDILAARFDTESIRFALLAPLILFAVNALILYAASRSSQSDLRAMGVR